MKKKAKKEMIAISYIIMGVLIAIVFPQILRAYSNNYVLIGQEPYYHARLTERIVESNILYPDELILGKRNLDYTPYHLASAGLSYLIGVEYAVRLVALISGLLSIVIFYLILKRFKIDKMKRIITIIIVGSSPAFLYTFNVMQDSLAILFTLLGIYFFFDKRRYVQVVSFLCFVIAGSFSLFNILIIVILLLIYSFVKKKRQKLTLAMIFGLSIIYAINPTMMFYKVIPTSANVLQEIISDIGGMTGFGIFYFILAVIGLLGSWKNRKEYSPMYAILVLFGLAYYAGGSYILVYMNFFVAIFAAIGMIKIMEIKWQMKMIKNLTFIIIACGLLFSMISFSTRMAELPPHKDFVDSLEWLSKNSQESDIVISDYSNGYFIEYFAEREVVSDSLITSYANPDERHLDTYSLFNAVNLADAERILNKYGIRYIIISENMKEKEIWGSQSPGLIHLFKDEETFKQVYDSENVEIWKYLKRG